MIKDLAIVICNFNKVDYLKGCLKTLCKSNLANLSSDIIVVDNASTDGSAQFIKDFYKKIILLENETNTGGSGGFDRGIKFAIQGEYKYLVLLDNDILLEENTILNLVKYIEVNPNVGVVGSKICTMDNPNILQEMGSYIDFEEGFNIKTPFKGYRDNDSLPKIVNCDYVPACCLITTNEVLNKVGSFNTDHFIYWDDMDWCTRIKREGFEIHAINESRVFHKMGVTNHANTFGVYYFERNRIMFFLKYLEEDKLEKFINKTCEWLISMTFFANLKGDFSTPKSLLLSFLDLSFNNLGRQDNSILEKVIEVDLLNKYKLSKENKVCLYLGNNIETNRKIFNYLNDIFKDDIKIVFANTDKSLISEHFIINEVLTLEDFHSNEFDVVFYALDHILNYNKSFSHSKNYIYIDGYFNTSSMNDIESVIISYKSYKDIFTNIFKPVYKEMLKKIRKEMYNAKSLSFT